MIYGQYESGNLGLLFCVIITNNWESMYTIAANRLLVNGKVKVNVMEEVQIHFSQLNHWLHYTYVQ